LGIDIFFHDLNLSQKFIIYDILKDKNQIYIHHIDDNNYITILIKENDIWHILNYDKPHEIIFDKISPLQLLSFDLLVEVINKIKLQDIYRLIQTNKYFNMLLETYSGNNEYWKRRFNIFINIINGYIIFKDSPDWIQNIFLEYKTKKLLKITNYPISL